MTSPSRPSLLSSDAALGDPFSLGEDTLSAERLFELSEQPNLILKPHIKDKLLSGAGVVATALKDKRKVYGVTTGFGASVEHEVDSEFAFAQATNLMRYHLVGLGSFYSEQESRAICIVRMHTLSLGVSGVRPELVERIMLMLRHGGVPRIPELGSVGASGDLTPLAYVAAAITGEEHVWVNGKADPDFWRRVSPHHPAFTLHPKESLAIMNGTTVMTAITALNVVRATYFAKLSSTCTSMVVDALRGNPDHFDARIFEYKSHPGSNLSSKHIRSHLGDIPYTPHRFQDKYSLRCAPQVIGVLHDTISFAVQLLHAELNGASDNPLLDITTQTFLHGGNFYGGHVCMAADALKIAVANVAELLERQLVQLNHPDTNHGLPANLVGVTTPDRFAHHGYKAMEITASSLVAEALKRCGPASVFSRSTESHNQDKVSMGSIAARELRTVLDLSEQVAMIHCIMTAQALELREKQHEPIATESKRKLLQIRSTVAPHAFDRPMANDVLNLWALYASNRMSFVAPQDPS